MMTTSSDSPTQCSKLRPVPRPEIDKFSGGLATFWEFPYHFMIKLVLMPETVWSISDLSTVWTLVHPTQLGPPCVKKKSTSQQNIFAVLSVLNSEIATMFEMLPYRKQGPSYHTRLISWLPLNWWHKEPEHRQYSNGIDLVILEYSGFITRRVKYF